ncbi:hypothetical protein GCM10020256_70830 [Streptomyces thermocoprophilus]
MARPDHALPASSAVAVKARPLVLAVMPQASTTAASVSGDGHTAPSAVSPITTAMHSDSRRIGRTRLPTRSDQRPAAIREPAPSTWATASSWPAWTALQPRTSTRNTIPNAPAVNCGTHSSALEACTRHNAACR